MPKVKLTKAEAMKVAEEIANGRCSLTHHHGEGKYDRAIRLSGCFLRDADEIGREIAAALPGGKYVQSGNFAAVWYDPFTSIAEHEADLWFEAAFIEYQETGRLPDKTIAEHMADQ